MKVAYFVYKGEKKNMSQLPAKVGASSTLFTHDRPANPRRSKFDLSRITNFTADAGMIIPFDWFLGLPGDDFNINFEFIMDTLPLVNASLTSYKVVTHWYKIDLKDLWEGWETFITRGRSGNVILNIPKIDLNLTLKLPVDEEFYQEGQSNIYYSAYPISHHSLSSFLGVPPKYSGIYSEDVVTSGNWNLNKDYLPYTKYLYQLNGVPTSYVTKQHNAIDTGFKGLRYVNALPFMAYQNIVKYNYVNQNLLEDNHSLFPVKGDHDWFLRYNASITNFVDYESNSEITGNEVYSYTGVYSKDDTVTRLDQLRYAQFDDDYFTSGLPWLQRGSGSDIPVDSSENVFETDVEVPSREVEWDNLLGYSGEIAVTGSSDTYGDARNTYVSIPKEYPMPIAGSIQYISTENMVGKLRVPGSTLSLSGNVSIGGLKMSVNALRESIAMQVWQERNARVNGSYNAMIYQHWLSNPHGEEHKPQYIGGTADYVSFSTILSSSATSVNGEDSPLGSTAGRGSTGGSAFVGNVHCNDYCYIFGIMIIKPNTTYMQGVEHHLCCENTFDDFPQPEFEGLSPMPILNKELYVSGNESDDNDMLCWQERYVYLKVRQNQNRGLFQVKPDKDRLFGSFTQARWFDSKPTFSYQFLCMSPDNMRRDFLAYPSYPAFKLQTASKVFVSRQLAYTSTPNTFGF